MAWDPYIKEIPPSCARAMAILSSDTDCMMAETIGILMVMSGSVPFLYFTRGVFRLTWEGMHWVDE